MHIQDSECLPLGRGCSSIADRANQVLAQSPVDFHFAIGFLARWTQGMDLSGLHGGLAVTTRFPGLSEYVPHVKEIGRGVGYVIGDSVVLDDADRTISLRAVLGEGSFAVRLS